LKRVQRCALFGVVLLFINSCSTTKFAPQSFAWWHLRHPGEVAGLMQYLEEQGLSEVLPISRLLRSASDWEQCNAEPFAVAPQQQWESVASVLRLLQFLESSGVISGRIQVFSGYRSPALNACAGGAAGSAHARSFALDFKVPGPVDPAAALCNFWRTEGRKWNMGYSVYPSGRIHIDTAGYRTWGYDHSGKTAVCSSL
jgi:hypothetical protein